MIGETTDVPGRLRYLRHRSSARCPCLMINKTGHDSRVGVPGFPVPRCRTGTLFPLDPRLGFQGRRRRAVGTGHGFAIGTGLIGGRGRPAVLCT